MILVSVGSYPVGASHTSEWQLNPSGHRLDWAISLVKAEERSGSLEFSILVAKLTLPCPCNLSFVGSGSMVGVHVASATRVDGGENEHSVIIMFTTLPDEQSAALVQSMD